jgi:Arc/MetJ-type ribon-helix-helix transcriptional regulator
MQLQPKLELLYKEILMMNFQLPPDLSAEIEHRLAIGPYLSADEVVRAAFSALRLQDEEVAAIQAGLDDLEAGRIQPIRAWDQQFRQERNIPTDR